MYHRIFIIALSALLASSLSCLTDPMKPTAINNPILPGFHPDPSCIFVKELDETFFCATSSFGAFPGFPIYASKDLQEWKLIGNALNRVEQLPELDEAVGPTSGLWAPTLRYRHGTFYVVTTLVYDTRPAADPARWDNFYITTNDIYDQSGWSNAIHFPFQGYDTSFFWADNETAYVVGSHAHRVAPGLHQTTIDLETGQLGGEFQEIWLGTGGFAVEAPHTYYKDGYYYLLAAEGGTGLNHMVTIARSRDIWGPYTYDEGVNPVLSNANTSAYFQTVGHADLFQDAANNWWAVALSTRSGPVFTNYPMGRETVLTPVTWNEGEWPTITPVNGAIETPLLPVFENPSRPPIHADDPISFYANSTIPQTLLHWRNPDTSAYTLSPTQPSSLILRPSIVNLTGNGSPGPRTFIGQRQTSTLFTFSLNLSYHPVSPREQAGVTVFLTEYHHLSLSITLYSANNETKETPHFKFAAASRLPVPEDVYIPVPSFWLDKRSYHLQVKAENSTHYVFSAAPAEKLEDLMQVAVANNSLVSWGFTGTLLGAFATKNGGDGTAKAEVSGWKYVEQGQVIE